PPPRRRRGQRRGLVYAPRRRRAALHGARRHHRRSRPLHDLSAAARGLPPRRIRGRSLPCRTPAIRPAVGARRRRRRRRRRALRVHIRKRAVARVRR
ncbi:MAG: hypothetical protein ACK55I_33220, partial [bacterium]